MLNWGQKIGLVEELLEKPSRTLRQNRNLIIDILLEIQALLKSCVVVEARFDGFAEQKQTETDLLQKRVEAGHQDAFDQRFPKRRDTFLSKTLGVLEKSSEIAGRLHWAIVKKDQFESMIQKLIGYNTSIEALLDSTAIDQLQHMQQQTYMALLQLNTNVMELKEVSMALKVKPATGPDQVQLQIGPLSKRPPDGDVDIARLADFKATQIQVETQTSEVILDPIMRASIHLQGASHEYRSEALFQKRPVWIEWKYIEIDLSLYPDWKDIIEQRIKKLVLLLQPANKLPEFNAPQCLGYFFDQDHDDDSSGGEGRYGFVYLKPPHTPADTAPVSLLELIQRSPHQGPPPSLSKRIALAHTLARSLMYFHSVNWLHKGLRSDNIIFFVPPTQALAQAQSNSSSRPPSLPLPPLISGFDYSRPDFPDEETEPPPSSSAHDIYRHPALLARPGVRSQREHDVYSLGIVLVEIAYWRRIDRVMEVPPDEGKARRRVRDVRRLLLDEQGEGGYLETVGGMMGEVYAGVVKRCLLGAAEEGVEERDRGVRMLEVFAEEIVGKLSDIKV